MYSLLLLWSETSSPKAALSLPDEMVLLWVLVKGLPACTNLLKRTT